MERRRDLLTMDARGFELWGLQWSDKFTFEGLSSIAMQRRRREGQQR
jgi:hypothetical protein